MLILCEFQFIIPKSVKCSKDMSGVKASLLSLIVFSVTAVDEQNAQTEEQFQRLKESPLYKADSSELLDVTESTPRRGLQADSETSRSAPTFSIFTLEAAPKTPIHSPRNLGKFYFRTAFGNSDNPADYLTTHTCMFDTFIANSDPFLYDDILIFWLIHFAAL